MISPSLSITEEVFIDLKRREKMRSGEKNVERMRNNIMSRYHSKGVKERS